MAKIPNDKYYTPQHIVDKCVNKVKEIVADDVTEIIEPSAGNGAFIESLNNNCIGDFAKEMYFYSNDKDLQYLVKNIDWKNELKTISTPYIPKGESIRDYTK